MKHKALLTILALGLLAMSGCAVGRSAWNTVKEAGDRIIDVAENATTNITSTVKSSVK